MYEFGHVLSLSMLFEACFFISRFLSVARVSIISGETCLRLIEFIIMIVPLDGRLFPVSYWTPLVRCHLTNTLKIQSKIFKLQNI